MRCDGRRIIAGTRGADTDRQSNSAEHDKRSRLIRELAKLDWREEQEMAEEGLGDESWPTL